MDGNAFGGVNAVLERGGDTVNGMVLVGVGNGEKNYHLCALKRGYGNKFDK